MRIYLHIGPDAQSSERLQQVLDEKRNNLMNKGVLFARSPGRRNHTRLFMAVSDPDRVDLLRVNRGFADPTRQARLREDVLRDLSSEVAKSKPDALILSSHQLGSALVARSELERLRDLLVQLSSDIHILAHVEDPARMLVRRYAGQLLDGRTRDLSLELGLTGADDWWDSALATRPKYAARLGSFGEVQGAVHWLDLRRLVTEWDGVFGENATQLRSIDMGLFQSPDVTEELRQAFHITPLIGRANSMEPSAPMSAAWATRARLFNDALTRLLKVENVFVPRQLWRSFLGEIKQHGPAIEAGSLSAISGRFAKDRLALMTAFPNLSAAAMGPSPACAPWVEADPEKGFRATQYLMAFSHRIKHATKEELARQKAIATPIPTPKPSAALPEKAHPAFAKLHHSSFAPHNRMGQVNEEDLARRLYARCPARPCARNQWTGDCRLYEKRSPLYS